MTAAFWIAFVATLATLAGALWTGFRRRRRAHLLLGPVSLVCLAVAILLAERLASVRDFPREPLRIHLWFAKSGALLALPVIVTGLLLWRSPRWRVAHRVCVVLFVAVTLIATGTGLWIFSQSTPKALGG